MALAFQALTLALALALSLPAPSFGQTLPSIDAPSFEPAIISVHVNGAARGDFFVQRMPSGPWLVRRDDLSALGLQVAARTAAMIDGVEHVALDTVEGLNLALDLRTLTLSITAPPDLLNRTVVKGAKAHRPLVAVSGEGAFLNWAIEQTLDHAATKTPIALSLEAGAWLGPVLLVSQGQTVTGADGTSHVVRLLTSATRDVPEQAIRWTFGDIHAVAGELGQGILLGGFSVGTLARLDPYRIRYPLGSVQGQALLPSEVDVYVDGQRVRTERVPPGPFEIRDLHTPMGARSVQLVVRDPFGRIQRFDQTLYASQRLLAPGLHDFQYAMGAVRRRYGQASFDYGAPAFTGRHDWGATDNLTLGLRAEARPGLVSGGGSLSLRPGVAGLLSIALGASQAGHLSGRAGQVRYDYQAPLWGAGLSWRADNPGYATLGEPPVLGNRRREWQVFASRVLGEGQSLWVSHSALTAHPAGRIPVPEGFTLASRTPRHNTSIGYTAFLRPWGGSFRLGVSRIRDDGQPARNELTASLVFFLDGGGLLSTQAQAGSGSRLQSVQWNRPAPAQEGWGVDLSATRQADAAQSSLNFRAATQWNAQALRLRADLSAQDTGQQHTLRLSASGGVARIGDQWFLSRPIDDSFAVVRVEGLAGIPVTVNGAPAGMTDARGLRFISPVSAHHETVIALDSRVLPIDRTVSSVQRRVVLPARSGTLIDFEARRLRAVTAQLMTPPTADTAQGSRPVARALLRLEAGPQTIETLTGLQGELYLENLPAGTYAGRAEDDSRTCHFSLVVPDTDEVLTELGALRCAPLPPSGQNRSDGPK